MRKLNPIEKGWLSAHVKPLLKELYGESPILIRYMSQDHMYPEHLVNNIVCDVEMMVCMLSKGAWINDDWRLYVRLAIAKRLRVRANLIFNDTFLPLKDQFLDLQLNGGSFKVQEQFKEEITDILRHPSSSQQDRRIARLMLSVVDEVQLNSLLQPFHWIRVIVAGTDPAPAYGMQLYQSEMIKQKKTLTTILRTDILF